MQPATLCYVVDGSRVLLIKKKRGLGAGKYVGPGGKIESGETPRECAIREVDEELEITVADPRKVGEFEFVFGDEPITFVHVFRTEEFAGEPTETAEAIPRWFDIEALPYDEMWEDDRYWMPWLFEGKQFEGRFVFDEDGEELLEHDLADGVTFD